jgi:hypothetical protein
MASSGCRGQGSGTGLAGGSPCGGTNTVASQCYADVRSRSRHDGAPYSLAAAGPRPRVPCYETRLSRSGRKHTAYRRKSTPPDRSECRSSRYPGRSRATGNVRAVDTGRSGPLDQRDCQGSCTRSAIATVSTGMATYVRGDQPDPRHTPRRSRVEAHEAAIAVTARGGNTFGLWQAVSRRHRSSSSPATPYVGRETR